MALGHLVLGVVATSYACDDSLSLRVMRRALHENRLDVMRYEGERLKLVDTSCALNPTLRVWIAQAAYQQGDFAGARNELWPVPDSASLAHRRLLAATYFMDPAGKAAWLEFDSLLTKAPLASLYSTSEHQLLQEVFSVLLDRQGPKLVERKSPNLAASLALFPGVGYAYAGDLKTSAATVVLLASLYSIAAVYAYHDAPMRAVGFTTLGAVFHFSSVVGSFRSAKVTNHRQRREFLKRFHAIWFDSDSQPNHER